MFPWNQIALLIAPPLLLATTYPVYQLLLRRYGKKWSYLGGFLFYWTLWCLFFPLALLGPQGLVGLFHGVSSPFGHPWWLGCTGYLDYPFENEQVKSCLDILARDEGMEEKIV
jgi:hypothetical protein